MTQSFFRRVMQGTYSGMQRYPRHLWASVREAAQGDAQGHRLVRPEWARNGAARMNGTRAGTPQIDLSATWIGHATVLLRVGEVNILTDPVFSRRIGMSVAAKTFGLARLAPPACKLDDLPPIDIVLLSHAHFDHLDKPTLKHIASDRTVIVTAERTRRLIPPGFAEVIELPWGETFEHLGVRILALEAAHWGARTALDQRRGYSSYLLDSAAGRVFFAGDTAYTSLFDQLGTHGPGTALGEAPNGRGRRAGVDLAIFGIGAYEPWINAHASPEQVWDMFTRMNATLLLPMHHSTFELGREPLDEPMKRLRLAARDDWERVVGRDFGETWRSPAGAIRAHE